MKLYQTEVVVARPGFLGGDKWELKNLKPITVLFGKNGSGKSLLLRGWRDSFVQDTYYVVPERGGTLAFDPGYVQTQLRGPEGRREVSNKNSLNEYRQHSIARVQAYLVARGATREGDLPGNIEDLEKLSAVLLPDFELQLLGANPPMKLRRAVDNSEVANIDELSSGEAQLITMGLDILTVAATWDIQQSPNRVLLVDEPDAHIHPDLQARFADFLIQVGATYELQIVVASHSTTLLAAIGQFGNDRAGVIYLDRSKLEFQAQEFTSTLKELSACLGGHALMGPLFGVPILLVEGDDDYRIWSQVPRHHVANFAVIPSNGDEIYDYQKKLEQIFSSLRDPALGHAGFALIDGDKALPQPNNDNPQSHVKFIQLNCHEAENLYLTDEVLSLLETDWENAKAKIVGAGKAGTYGNKSEKLTQADQWDRRSTDLKDVINEIASILDPKNVHWTVRVGVAIGRSKPSGQLAEFLGPALLDSLWPSIPQPHEEVANETV